jgi:dienelactone hydrolase
LENGTSPASTSETLVEIKTPSVSLQGVLSLSRSAKSVVVFAHGSGSGRFSPRNAHVARVLQDSGLGTLLFDLLTKEEDQFYGSRFNIDLLARRLAEATDWLRSQRETGGVQVAYFGASTGAAAALQASVGREIHAIVSRGGRPDLAGNYLGRVEAPTLLIVGGRDTEVLNLNREAFDALNSEKKLVVVPGATHLFEEPGALEEVARLAADWFLRFLK